MFNNEIKKTEERSLNIYIYIYFFFSGSSQSRMLVHTFRRRGIIFQRLRSSCNSLSKIKINEESHSTKIFIKKLYCSFLKEKEEYKTLFIISYCFDLQ